MAFDAVSTSLSSLFVHEAEFDNLPARRRSSAVRVLHGVLTLNAGEHACLFYRGRRELDELLTEYVGEGIQSNEDCLCIVDPDQVDSVRDRLPVRSHVHATRLDICSSADTYLENGAFSANRMTAVIDAYLRTGTRTSRCVGVMAWCASFPLGWPDIQAYESSLNWVFQGKAATGLCCYDLDLFGGDTVLGVLRTHPKVIFGRTVVDSPYYVAP